MINFQFTLFAVKKLDAKLISENQFLTLILKTSFEIFKLSIVNLFLKNSIYLVFKKRLFYKKLKNYKVITNHYCNACNGKVIVRFEKFKVAVKVEKIIANI